MTFSYFIYFLVIAFAFAFAEEKRFLDWGVYCGEGHSNQYGVEPLDQMDRYCQYHDICVTVAGYLSCWCNEQLYYLISNAIPQSQEESDVKDSILTFIYDAIVGCENYWGFDTAFLVTKVENEPENRGYNYLPWYPSYAPLKYTIKLDSSDFTGILLKFNEIEYYTFTDDIYNDPIKNIARWMSHKVSNITSEKQTLQVNPGEYYVLYNPSQVQPSAFLVKNMTDCLE